MKYGICTSNDFKTSIGSVYALENLDGCYYFVKEGNCDAIKKDAVTLISEVEYSIIRKAHSEIMKNINMFSEETREYFESLYKLRNTLEDKQEQDVKEHVDYSYEVIYIQNNTEYITTEDLTTSKEAESLAKEFNGKADITNVKIAEFKKTQRIIKV